MDDDVKLATLNSMGFDLDVARAALVACDGDVERAIEHCLLGGGGGGGAASASATAAAAETGTLIRVSDVSQYTAGPEGRSACTCIALCYAKRFLVQVTCQAQTSMTAADAIVDESFLSEGLLQGVALYNKIKASGSGSASVEHMSAEEVLNSMDGKAEFVDLKLDAPVQGVLSPDLSSPLGMHAVLAGCQSERQWVAVIITKSPETVVIVLPPSSGQTSKFFLFDSHPRPQLSASGSYAMAHASVKSLVGTLLKIFPFTDLGSDVGEMMQMMYNSFDAYVLHM